MPLKVSDGIGAYIDDFQKSDAPQFKGKNKQERRDMAIAAYLTAKRGGLPQKETVRSADRKPEIYLKPDGRRGIRMVPTDREVIKKESVYDPNNHNHVKAAIHNTKNSVEGIAAIKKKFGVDHKKASNMLDKAIDRITKNESVEEKYTDRQRIMRDMGRNQPIPPASRLNPDPSGVLKKKISQDARNISKHMGGSPVRPQDLARRVTGGQGGHETERGIKKRKVGGARNPDYAPVSRDVLARKSEGMKEEMNFAVSIDGLPTMFMSADSPGMLKQTLRKIVKQPSMIKAVKRVTDAAVKKTFRLKAQGKEEENEE